MYVQVFDPLLFSLKDMFIFVCYLDMLELAERRLFLNGWPVKSVIALSSQQFRIAGELMVMSMLQGGPAPNFLDSEVYAYISRTTLDPDKNTNIVNKNIAKNVGFSFVDHCTVRNYINRKQTKACIIVHKNVGICFIFYQNDDMSADKQ